MRMKRSLKQKNKKEKSEQQRLKQASPSVHPWRVCSYGEHWVITHPMRVPPSKLHPAGSVATRRGHCAKNPSGKDQLYPDEISEITQQSFKDLKSKPCSNELGFKEKGAQFDELIAGWTKYWNEDS